MFALRKSGDTALRIRNVYRRYRPPNITVHQPPRPRTFNHRSQLLLVAPSITRPQIPYLHATSRALPKVILSAQVARFISTERKARWKKQIKWQIKFQLYFWPIAGLLFLVKIGYDQIQLETEYPTPHEWSMMSRWHLRTTRVGESLKVLTYKSMKLQNENLLARLEDPNIDGAGIREQAEGGIYVQGVGKTGFDITAKSEPWRRGYYQCLMGCARAAEHLDGLVWDRSRQTIFFAGNVVGPSNPRPVPVPYGMGAAPKAEDCEPAFANPEVYYMKILTTQGLTTGQRMDAALAYASWLDFKELPDTAKSMYDWALDIAASGLPAGRTDVVDLKTGILNSHASAPISANLLKASTALAVHQATTGNTKAALPIFLSVLKARKELPAAPSELLYKQAKPQESSSISAVVDFFREKPYPAPDPSGDEPPFHTLKEACEEVGLMTYIGEIIFAASSKEKGLSWTRDSVDAAEAIMQVMREQEKPEGRERCRECLSTGLTNWKLMAKGLMREAEEKTLAKKSGWFGSSKNLGEEEVGKWQHEQERVESRFERALPLLHSAPG